MSAAVITHGFQPKTGLYVRLEVNDQATKYLLWKYIVSEAFCFLPYLLSGKAYAFGQ